MKPRGSMPHSQGLSNNPYPELNELNSSYWYIFLLRPIPILSSHLRLDLPNGLFPVVLSVKILKALLPSSILATCPAYLNLLQLAICEHVLYGKYHVLPEGVYWWLYRNIDKERSEIGLTATIKHVAGHPDWNTCYFTGTRNGNEEAASVFCHLTNSLAATMRVPN